MKKVIITLAAIVFGAAAMSAQDKAQVTELFNSGAASLSNGEKTEALATFQKVLSQATALGEDGLEIVQNCQNVIPNIIASIAKDLFKDGKIDEAVAKLKEAVAASKEYGNEEEAAEDTKLIGQFLSQKGANALNAKDFATAVSAYKDVLAIEPENGTAALRLGMALSATDDAEGAEEAFKQAAANGQEAAANKQLGNLALKGASAALKTKDYKTALEKALQSAEINPSANAFKIAGTAAAQLKQYKDAANYFGKYLEINPSASDAAQIKANIEAFKKL